MRPLADGIMAALARLLVWVFFRGVETTGGAEVPSGPVVMVANHHNGLVDGLVLLAASPRYPRFLGKATLWKVTPLRPFLALAGVVPVYREADESTLAHTGGSSRRQAGNDAAFEQSRGLLLQGGAVAVFPEGISHDEFSLQRLRTGAARIALGAAADADVTGIHVVPVGLYYDDKSRFRSRALVRFGPGRAVDAYVDRYRHDPIATVRALTADMAVDLRGIGPDFSSRSLAERCTAIARLLVSAPTPTRVDAGSLALQEVAARELAEAVTDPARHAEFDALTSEVDRYEARLKLLRIEDRHLLDAAAGRPATPRWAGAALRDGMSLLAAPLAGAGLVIHAVPYTIIKQVARRPTNEGMKATVKLLGCCGLFTLTYLALGAAVGRRRGWRAGVAAFGLAPVCGWTAVRYFEEAERTGGASRRVDSLRRRRTTMADLLERRGAIVIAANSLLEPQGETGRRTSVPT